MSRGRCLARQRRDRGRLQRGLGDRDQDSVSEDGGSTVSVGMERDCAIALSGTTPTDVVMVYPDPPSGRGWGGVCKEGVEDQ